MPFTFAFVPARSITSATHEFHMRTGQVRPAGTSGSDCVLPLEQAHGAHRHGEMTEAEGFVSMLLTLIGHAPESDSDAAFANALYEVRERLEAYLAIGEVDEIYALEAQYAEQEPADEWPDPATRTLPLRETDPELERLLACEEYERECERREQDLTEGRRFDFSGEYLRFTGLRANVQIPVVTHGAFMCAQYTRGDGKVFSVSGAIGAYCSNRDQEQTWTHHPHTVEVAVFDTGDPGYDFTAGWVTTATVAAMFDQFLAFLPVTAHHS